MLLRRRWKGQRDRGKTGGEQFPQFELTFDGGVREKFRRLQGLDRGKTSSARLLVPGRSDCGV